MCVCVCVCVCVSTRSALVLKLKGPIVSLVTTVKEIAKTMFVNTNVSCIISFSFSFSLLYCHKNIQNKKFYIFKT